MSFKCRARGIPLRKDSYTESIPLNTQAVFQIPEPVRAAPCRFQPVTSLVHICWGFLPPLLCFPFSPLTFKLLRILMRLRKSPQPFWSATWISIGHSFVLDTRAFLTPSETWFCVLVLCYVLWHLEQIHQFIVRTTFSFFLFFSFFLKPWRH